MILFLFPLLLLLLYYITFAIISLSNDESNSRCTGVIYARLCSTCADVNFCNSTTSIVFILGKCTFAIHPTPIFWPWQVHAAQFLSRTITSYKVIILLTGLSWYPIRVMNHTQAVPTFFHLLLGGCSPRLLPRSLSESHLINYIRVSSSRRRRISSIPTTYHCDINSDYVWKELIL